MDGYSLASPTHRRHAGLERCPVSKAHGNHPWGRGPWAARGHAGLELGAAEGAVAVHVKGAEALHHGATKGQVTRIIQVTVVQRQAQPAMATVLRWCDNQC